MTRRSISQQVTAQNIFNLNTQVSNFTTRYVLGTYYDRFSPWIPATDLLRFISEQTEYVLFVLNLNTMVYYILNLNTMVYYITTKGIPPVRFTPSKK